MMRKSVWAGMAAAVLLAGCASTGVYESDSVLKQSFNVATNYEAAFRRAGEYVRACHQNVQHPYGAAYAWRHSEGKEGAPNEIQVYKVGEPAKVLELIATEADGPATSKVTVTVLNEGRWDAAEIEAARRSIQTATPVCRGS